MDSDNHVLSRAESSFAGRLLSWLLFLENALTSVRVWWAVCLLWAGILAWTNRHLMNADGLSYLDLASEALSGGPAKLVNAYWSPAYPALISVALLVFRPSPSREIPLIHLVNFLVFAGVLWSFTFFVRGWLATHHTDGFEGKEEKTYIIPFAFCMFLWFTMEFIGVGVVTPDLCVAGIVFLVAGIGSNLSLRVATWKHYAALGIVLAVGYYAKSAMFPIGLGFLAVLFVWPPSGNVSRQKLVLSVLIFVLLAAPLIALVSSRAGRPSFGETGRLAYLWYANHRELVSFGGWMGTFGDSYQALAHPPRTLIQRPLTFEFATPLPGTYPLWYDPSYWWAGAKTGFDLRQQLAALNENLEVYKDALFHMSGIAAGAIVLFVLAIHKKALSTPRRTFWQLAWPIMACSMYAVVHVEYRFVGALFLLVWFAVYGLLLFAVDVRARTVIIATVLGTVMIPSTTHLIVSSAQAVQDLIRPRQIDYAIAAEGLRRIGVQDGDRLAVVGGAFDSYYARLARVRVIAQIPNADEFWRLGSPDLSRVEERLAAIGIRAIVARDKPLNSAPANWRELPVVQSTRFSILPIGTRDHSISQDERDMP